VALRSSGAASAKAEQGNTGGSDPTQNGDRVLRRPRREDELEQRHWIIESILKEPEWAVAAICNDEHALGQESGDGHLEARAPTACECAPPHVSDREQEAGSDRGVNRAKDDGRR
jgi:hypothetical protein